ncbi:AfsR/SARP family transcriptional regulator [Streptomyces virginiae]|uniref:AfsR/SARP family transcriptional regulator n=1 Tax=Streptomyces virginiae TaxID=1961 RepID=UPI003F541C5C
MAAPAAGPARHLLDGDVRGAAPGGARGGPGAPPGAVLTVRAAPRPRAVAIAGPEGAAQPVAEGEQADGRLPEGCRAHRCPPALLRHRPSPRSFPSSTLRPREEFGRGGGAAAQVRLDASAQDGGAAGLGGGGVCGGSPPHNARPWSLIRPHRQGTSEAAAALAAGPAAEIEALVHESPYDEPLRAQQLRALRAAGRPADALAAYERTRRALADGLGTDPGPELTPARGTAPAAAAADPAERAHRRCRHRPPVGGPPGQPSPPPELLRRPRTRTGLPVRRPDPAAPRHPHRPRRFGKDPSRRTRRSRPPRARLARRTRPPRPRRRRPRGRPQRSRPARELSRRPRDPGADGRRRPDRPDRRGRLQRG